jgi:hypothetical protein
MRWFALYVTRTVFCLLSSDLGGLKGFVMSDR